MDLIADYRTAHAPTGHPLLLPRENGRALDRHTVTRFINKARAAAGLPHIDPHRLRHTLATQAINRGMSLEAIAAMLGHRSMDMTLRCATIANCTRPTELDCAFESICESCSFFQTSIEFRPTLQAQHDDAAKKGQHHRTDLVSELLAGLTEGEAS